MWLALHASRTALAADSGCAAPATVVRHVLPFSTEGAHHALLACFIVLVCRDGACMLAVRGLTEMHLCHGLLETRACSTGWHRTTYVDVNSYIATCEL